MQRLYYQIPVVVAKKETTNYLISTIYCQPVADQGHPSPGSDSVNGKYYTMYVIHPASIQDVG